MSRNCHPEHCGAWVCYRRPHGTTYTQLIQHNAPLRLASPQELPTQGGFVVMPFVVSAECPLLFIQPDEVGTFPLELAPLPSASRPLATDEAEQRALYGPAFAACLRALESGRVEKVVLSRRLGMEVELDDVRSLFLRACQLRPASFVALWHTEATGWWLVATPEPLLIEENALWRTVALAGTLPYEANEPPQWNRKNRQEQALVADFIAARLDGIAEDVAQSEPHTLRSGNGQHICTDCSFVLPSRERIPALLQRLHPTPAVCGVPREAAMQTILEAEPTPRRYYSGFCGPLGLHGETALYVSLRCMSFTRSSATLYAGGGILPESRLEEEWEETRRKLLTMALCTGCTAQEL